MQRHGSSYPIVAIILANTCRLERLVPANLRKTVADKREPPKTCMYVSKLCATRGAVGDAWELTVYRGANWLGGCSRVIARRCAACALLVDAPWCIGTKAAFSTALFYYRQECRPEHSHG